MSRDSPVRRSLQAHRAEMEQISITDLFAADPRRFERFSIELDDLLFDFSKNRVDGRTVALLADLAEEAGVERRRRAMFAGEAINVTEDRAALHVALRHSRDSGFKVGGSDVMAGVHDELRRLESFSHQLRDRRLTGATGKPFTDVVNIGIGGSDLGPAMATAALRPYHDGPRIHFVSNVDGAHISDTLKTLDPGSTLVIVASKTFTTDETMTNARTARSWLVRGLGEAAVADHFVALSTNMRAVEDFGIREPYRFGFWDWVGGRYSVWSAIGLPLCLAIGYEAFAAFLAGAAVVDDHFRAAPAERNIPMMMGLLGDWHRNLWGYPTHAVIPYDQHLARLPAYLQQLDMESNGKRVRLDGSPVGLATGPVVWGEPGTNSQHAFFQLIHQGTDVVPVDFLLAANDHDGLPEHHDRLAANCFAQSEALMRGRTESEVLADLRARDMAADHAARLAPHKVMPGNRPSNTLLYPRLDPRTLGMILALYEHKVFVMGALWGINSFDQWGVELGKTLAGELLPMVRGTADASDRDPSTAGLIKNYLEKKR